MKHMNDYMDLFFAPYLIDDEESVFFPIPIVLSSQRQF